MPLRWFAPVLLLLAASCAQEKPALLSALKLHLPSSAQIRQVPYYSPLPGPATPHVTQVTACKYGIAAPRFFMDGSMAIVDFNSVFRVDPQGNVKWKHALPHTLLGQHEVSGDKVLIGGSHGGPGVWLADESSLQQVKGGGSVNSFVPLSGGRFGVYPVDYRDFAILLPTGQLKGRVRADLGRFHPSSIMQDGRILALNRFDCSLMSVNGVEVRHESEPNGGLLTDDSYFLSTAAVLIGSWTTTADKMSSCHSGALLVFKDSEVVHEAEGVTWGIPPLEDRQGNVIIVLDGKVIHRVHQDGTVDKADAPAHLSGLVMDAEDNLYGSSISGVVVSYSADLNKRWQVNLKGGAGALAISGEGVLYLLTPKQGLVAILDSGTGNRNL